jgi:hypothetical protein
MRKQLSGGDDLLGKHLRLYFDRLSGDHDFALWNERVSLWDDLVLPLRLELPVRYQLRILRRTLHDMPTLAYTGFPIRVALL